MPSLSVPKLHECFQQLGVCIVVESDSAEFRDWVRQNVTPGLRAAFGNGDTRFWADLTLEEWDDETFHFHVELSREPVEKSIACSVADFKDRVLKIVDKLSGETVFIRTRAKLEVNRAEIPEHGSIAGLLRYSASPCGSVARLVEGCLSFEDDIFDKLSFKEMPGGNAICIVIEAVNWSEIDEKYLKTAQELMLTGVDCFVFERISREAFHA